MKLDWLALAGLILTTLALTALWGPGEGLADAHNQSNQERTIVSMQPATLSPGVKIPPLDAAVPAHTETATFALG